MPVPVEDRLFSLVLALLATEPGLTKAEILSSVRGYAQRYTTGGDNANLERQFERDKDDIRELGVPLETIEPLGEPGDNHNLRYRIPKGAYDLPEDVRFTSDEIALLNLAGMVWREGSLNAESRRALVKLRALGIAADEPVLGYAPRVRLRDPAFEPLTPGDRPAAARALPVPQAGGGRVRASARSSRSPSCSTTDAGTCPPRRSPPATTRRSCCAASWARSTAGKPAPARAGDHKARALAGLEAVWESGVAELEVRAGRMPRCAWPIAGARRRRRPASCACTTSISRSSPTSSPASAPRCSCSSPPRSAMRSSND